MEHLLERIHVSNIVTKPEAGSVVFNDVFLTELMVDAMRIEKYLDEPDKILYCDIDLDAIASIRF